MTAMQDRPRVYIETTIPSFLVARPSNNLIVAGKQQTTRQWWDARRGQYRLCTSQYVLDEVCAGDAAAARQRMEVLENMPLLEIDDPVVNLARLLLDTNLIPLKSATDAGHIAVAARHNIDFLVTWNCTHIANAELLRKINYLVAEAGYILPTVCTPDELFGGEENDAQ